MTTTDAFQVIALAYPGATYARADYYGSLLSGKISEQWSIAVVFDHGNQRDQSQSASLAEAVEALPAVRELRQRRKLGFESMDETRERRRDLEAAMMRVVAGGKVVAK